MRSEDDRQRLRREAVDAVEITPENDRGIWCRQVLAMESLLVEAERAVAVNAGAAEAAEARVRELEAALLHRMGGKPGDEIIIVAAEQEEGT